MEKIGEYEVHRVASMFPMLSEDDATELKRSIETNGQRHAIYITKKKVIVDGRNRLKACLELGVEPMFEIFPSEDEKDIAEFTLDSNLHRRHLTTSQRAALAAEIRKVAGLTAKEAAKALNVSRSSVTTAERVAKKGGEKLKEAVRDGRVDLGTADKALESTPEVQEAVAGSKDRTEARSRAKKSDADFSKKKWRDSAERKLSTVLSQVPVDLKDWANREVRDIVGAPSKRESAPSDPSAQIVATGEDVTLIGVDEFVDRIDRGLKDVPSGERKRLRVDIGKVLVGAKAVDYLPSGKDCDGCVKFVQMVIAEVKVRAAEAKDVLDDSQLKPFRVFIKALKAMIPEDAESAPDADPETPGF